MSEVFIHKTRGRVVECIHRGDVVSAINRLAKNMFPGCFNKSCPFICKASGELKITLCIDKWMIQNAKDFHEVSRLK